MTRLTKKAWNNSKLTVHTKIQIYRAYVREHSPVWQRVLDIACPTGSESSMLFTCAASGAFWPSPGRTRSQTTLSWKELDAPVCSRCWNRDVCAGSATSCAGRWTDPQRPPLWRTRGGKTSHRQTTTAIQRCVQKGPKSLDIDQNNWEATALRRVSLETDCAEWSLPTSKRRSLSSTGKREWEERLQPMQTGQRQTLSVSSATGTVIPASDWLATLDAVPEKNT